MNYFSELKRRNVFKVAIAYLMLSWLILQIVDVLTPALFLPEMLMRIVFVVLAMVFPVILIITWAFELTPDGFKKTLEVEADESILKTTGQKINYAIIGFLILVIGFQFWMNVDSANTDHENTIAVMPFTDMSADQSQEYFGDGIAEEILNLLVPIDELDVTSRTSSFALKGQNLLAPEIATQLDVNYIVEGSIRRDGNNVRVTAQLIDVENDTHLWSETYDRELVSIFAIQDEISTAITNALQVELIGGEIVREVPTQNMDAYALYLQGHQLFIKRGYVELISAIELLEQAVTLDPEFAEAWADLGGSRALIPAFSAELMSDYASIAFEAVNMAISLEPSSGQAWAVKGYIHEQLFEWKLADVAHKHAVELNPSNETAWLWLAGHYLETGDLPNAEVAIRRAIEIAPNTSINNGFLGRILLAQGRIDEAKPVVELAINLGWGPSNDEKANIALLENDPELAIEAMTSFGNYNPTFNKDVPIKEAVEAYFNPVGRDQVIASLRELSANGMNIPRKLG